MNPVKHGKETKPCPHTLLSFLLYKSSDKPYTTHVPNHPNTRHQPPHSMPPRLQTTPVSPRKKKEGVAEPSFLGRTSDRNTCAESANSAPRVAATPPSYQPRVLDTAQCRAVP
ncbi:hypothetical protein ACJQWK_08148 [Exserohilum turcicum]